MTVFVTSQHERALVEITPTAKTLLSVGTHAMYLAGCTISIDMKIFGMLLVLTVPRTTHCIVSTKSSCSPLLVRPGNKLLKLCQRFKVQCP